MHDGLDVAPRGGLRLGIDIGGTFTDFALVDSLGSRVGVHKQLTTPRDPSYAVLEGTLAICQAVGCSLSDLVEIVHGTTLVTNALIERRGDRTGMLVTQGFRDLFDIGREQRYDLFDLRLRYAEPIVERGLRADIPERLKHDGSVLVPLDEEAVAAQTRRLVEEERIEALAICFLHAHVDDRHERRAREIAGALYPALHISHSADVFPYPREFERWTTTCANAYSQPLVDRYLSRLETGLAEAGFRGRLWIMASSGGLMNLDMARRYPVKLLESGPAAGVLVAARIGTAVAGGDLLSFDLGGTTAKGALIHRLIRAGSALFTAHTNADAAAPGVSDALAETIGLTVEGVLDPAAGGPALDKWVIFVPAESSEAVRAAVFGAGAGQMGDYSRCSWSVAGSGQFLPGPGAAPAVGSVGSVEHVPEDRIEVIAPAALRPGVLAAMRAAHPYEEPAFDVFSLAPLPTGLGIGRIGTLPRPQRLADFVAQVGSALPQTSWGVRAAGDPDALVTRVAVCGGAGDSLLAAADAAGVQAYLTADLRHHPADEHRRRSGVALVDVAHWASEYPWCGQATQLLRSQFGAALTVNVCPLRSSVHCWTWPRSMRNWVGWPTVRPTCPSSSATTRLSPISAMPPTGWRSSVWRWRTSTLRYPGWSPRPTACANARTATAACSTAARSTPNSSKNFSTSSAPCSAGRAVSRIRCWR